MSWQNPRTATPEQSIWRDLPEDTFRRHLVDLEAKSNGIPIDPRVFSADEWLSTRPRECQQSHTLPLAIEQQVADDFAFLAAVTEGAQSVAAVCLEESPHPTLGLTLRFATLDSLLNDDIKSGLGSITQILIENATTAPKDRQEPNTLLDKLLETIIILHQTRLLARLRSTKWSKPKYLSKSHKKPLYKDIPNLLHRIQFLYLKSEKGLRASIESSISSLQNTYTTFETSPSSTDLLSLKALINASHTFCCQETVKDLSTRLKASQKASKPTPQLASALKTLRQIEKIASYRRVSLSLLQTSSTYKELFSDIRTDFLTPYHPVPTTIAHESWAKQTHIHAEIQLVVHYDLFSPSTSPSTSSPQNLRPRCLGTSKHLCYLCYLFLSHHSSFFPSKTHGRLYDQWTIPDLAEFSEEVGARYRGIICGIDEEVVRMGELEEEGMGERLMPMTSVEMGPFVER